MTGPLLISILIAGTGFAILYLSRGEGTSRVLIHELLRERMAASCRETTEIRESVRWRRSLSCLGGAALAILIVTLIGGFTPKKLLLSALIGCLAGEWWSRYRRSRREVSLSRLRERSLPMVMERLVMAVGTGLDVIPALKEAAAGGNDPISAAIARMVKLAEDGLSVEESIKTISEESRSSSLKHALMHIRLAYQQGGEVVRPLRELSDATQNAYQEGVEEEIAKLPVKAVVPLLVTFAGLIVCFLTVPLIQVGTIAKRVTHVGP